MFIKAFKNKHYNGSNSVVCITGNLNEKSLEQLVLRSLGNMAKGVKVKDPIINAKKSQENEFIKGKFNNLKHIKIDFNGYKLKDTNRYAFSILSFLIDAYLNEVIKYKKGLAYVVNSKNFYTNSYGLLSIYSAADSVKVIEEIFSILQKIRVDEHTLSLAKINVTSDLIFNLEYASQILDFYATNHLFENPISIQNEIDNFKKVSLNDVKYEYQKLLKDSPVITVLG